MDFLTRILATTFGIGYIPFIPATWASAVATGLVWFLPSGALAPICAVSTAIGLLACAPAVRVFHSKDPQKFVWDEVCGIFVTFLFLPKTPLVAVTGFLLFRCFDGLKPWPISKLQKLDHPLAIMWDDLAAGLVSNLILQIAVRTVFNLQVA